MTTVRPVLIAGEWRASDARGSFHACAPASGASLDDAYPISRRSDVLAALEAGVSAARSLAQVGADRIAEFLEAYADGIEARKDELSAMAHTETALPISPRLADVELPRTTGQLRQAAAAAREGSWALPTIDTQTGIRSIYAPLEAPVAIFGPNNFPLAFNAISGGDFAAAIAAGNPVIAKSHPAHPSTTRIFAEIALEALRKTSLPLATVQLLYHMDPDDGFFLVSHESIGASAYTGSRRAGLALKEIADRAGKPIYLELSSVNPVFFLPGAIEEKGEALVDELVTSALMAAGQFCTNPGVIVLRDDEAGRAFVAQVAERYAAVSPGPLLAAGVLENLESCVRSLASSGATCLAGGARAEGDGYRFENTALRVSGADFLADSLGLQREAFGNATLFVLASDDEQMRAIAASFEGNLTGGIYSHSDGREDALYDAIARELRPRVGRLLNDKMPTGVAVSAAMQHGGPYPATGHPGFTSVGIPASLRRFAQLQAYDNVRPHRLPAALRDESSGGGAWRSIDGQWTR